MIDTVFFFCVFLIEYLPLFLNIISPSQYVHEKALTNKPILLI